jgi:hypothetical protein
MEIIGANSCCSYLLQTKNPARFLDYIKTIPFNTWLCTTLESNREYPHIYGDSPSIADRVKAFAEIDNAQQPYNIHPKMITIEPVLDFDITDFIRLIKSCGPLVRQVNIGADTGNNKLPEPPKEKVIELIAELKKFTKVFEKKNLKRLIA